MDTTASNLCVEYFPSPPQLAGGSDVGVACSGGGTRALVTTMGQLRALKALNLLDKVSMISSVSGGTWGAALFTYLPASISDDEFLGPVVAPDAITVQSLGDLAAHNLGIVPQRLSLLELGKAVVQCVEAGYASWDLWQGIVGKCIFKPFALWDVNARRYPAKYYAASAASAAAVVARNPELSLADFYVPQRARPRLVMNGAMFSNPNTEGSQVLPFQSTPTGIGIAPFFKGMGVYGWDIGGGLIDTIGMGSTLSKVLSPTEAEVTQPGHRFSLSDMAAISSAAFAHALQAQLSHLSYPMAEAISPTYSYWPVGNMDTKPWRYGFADGGCIENTGIPALISHGVRNIVAFINQQTPIQNGIESQISGLFGQPSGPSEPYMIPPANPAFGQIFQQSDYTPLINGLRAAAQNGPAMFLQTLQTLPNTNFGVPSCQVRVLWVCINWVDAWTNALQPKVKQLVMLQRQLYKFPYYDTVLQLEMSPTQVNLLAHLTCWSLQTNAAMVRQLFGSA